jgi:mannose-6-phosphate isomerase-like protein (cupin superfamily)
MQQIKQFSINKTKESFQGPWDPKDLLDFAGLTPRVARFEGVYGDSPHAHTYDEFFLVLEGRIKIATELGEIVLETFDGAVIPAGVHHQPTAEQPALVLMLDPKE